MVEAALPPPRYAHPRYAPAPDRRSRIIAALLSAALVLMMGVVLVEMGVVDLSVPLPPAMVSVTVPPPPPARSGGGARHKIIAKQAPHTANAPIAQQRPTTPHPAPQPRPAAAFIHLSSQEFASADIGRMARPDASDSGAGSGDAGKTYGPGEGPGGEQLYNAKWYREPSSAELNPYFQHYPPAGSWADIRCRTAEHYHVEDCEEIGESEPGLGASRALRQAGWQFLIVPPRLNGQPMIGAWVKVRMYFVGVRHSRHSEDDPAGPPP